MIASSRVTERRAERRRVARAASVSLLLHLIIIFGVAWFYMSVKFPEPQVPEDFEMTFVESPQPPKTMTRFVDVAPDVSAPPPQEVPFESDRDSAAASQNAPAGDAPVPTQEGRKQANIELQERSLAVEQVESAPPTSQTSAAEQTPPTPQNEAKAADKPELEKPIAADATGLLAKVEPKQESQQKQKPELTRSTTPPSSRSSYQRQTRVTRLRGSVDNRGRPAVASLATPLGRYRKAISDAVGSSWYHHIGPRMDMFSYGTVSVLFVVDRMGKVRRPKITSNTSNESFEIVTLESILSAEIPPIPPDVLGELEGGQIEIDFSFSIITD